MDSQQLDIEQLSRRQVDRALKEAVAHVQQLQEHVKALEAERDLLAAVEIELQYALTRRTSILANALGPCGLLGSDRTSSSNSNSGNNTSSSASALQLQSRAQGQGQPTGQLQAQGQAVSQGQGQDQARALPDPFECPPKRIRDVPPVAKWDMQWREWALSAKSQEVSRLFGTAVEEASILVMKAEVYGAGTEPHKQLAALICHTWQVINACGLSPSRTRNLLTWEELPEQSQEELERVAQNLGFTVTQLQSYAKMETAALTSVKRFATPSAEVIQQLRAALAGAAAAGSSAPPGSQAPANPGAYSHAHAAPGKPSAVHAHAQAHASSSYGFQSLVEGAAQTLGAQFEAFMALIDAAIGSLSFQQLVRASVLTFPRRPSYCVILRAALDMHEQGRLKVAEQDKGIKETAKGGQSPGSTAAAAAAAGGAGGGAGAATAAAAAPPFPGNAHAASGAGGSDPTKQQQAQQQAPQAQQEQEMQGAQGGEGAGSGTPRAALMHPPYIPHPAGMWRSAKKRQQEQQQEPDQNQQQLLLGGAGPSAHVTTLVDVSSAGAGGHGRKGPAAVTRPEDLEGKHELIEACLVNLRRLAVDEAPLLAGLGKSSAGNVGRKGTAAWHKLCGS